MLDDLISTQEEEVEEGVGGGGSLFSIHLNVFEAILLRLARMKETVTDKEPA